MNERSRSRRDFFQNITIALLTVSAVLLFIQTQVNYLDSDILPFFSPSETHSETSAAVPSNPFLTAPVRVAVKGPYGRYGNVTLTTAAEEFEPLRGLLEQSFDSMGASGAGSERGFFTALQNPSVYYDFLSPLPLSVLADLVRSQGDSGNTSARCLVLTVRENDVLLYAWDGEKGYTQYTTALSPDDISETIEQYELSNALFSHESTEDAAQAVAKHSLFLQELPELTTLTSESPLPDTSRLLSLLGFNPNTQNRYPTSDGAEVILEGERNLRIRANGTVLYQDGGINGFSINSAEEIPSLTEAVSEVGVLLNSLLSGYTGEANLYLESIQQTGKITTLRFGYQVNGIPVRFSDDYGAAYVTLSGTTLSSMTLRLRQYTDTGVISPLLPLRQALAIASHLDGAELSIGYTDDRTGTVSAQWLAD